MTVQTGQSVSPGAGGGDGVGRAKASSASAAGAGSPAAAASPAKARARTCSVNNRRSTRSPFISYSNTPIMDNTVNSRQPHRSRPGQMRSRNVGQNQIHALLTTWT